MRSGSVTAIASPRRLKAVRRTGLLGSPEEETFDRLTRLAARVLQAPVALFALADDRRLFLKSVAGRPEAWADVREIPLHDSLCAQVVATGEPLLVSDVRNSSARDVAIARALNVVAYAGVPVFDAEGQVLGSLAVVDHRPRVWSEGEVEILHELTAVVAEEVERAVEVRETTGRENVDSLYLDRLFDAAAEGIAFVDTDDRVLRVNPEFTRIFGYSQEEAEGRLLNDLIVPDEERAEAVAHSGRVLSAERVRFDGVRMRKDGTRIPVTVLAAPIETEAGQIAVCAIYRDITERQRAAEALRGREQRFRALIENAADAVVVLAASGVVEYASPAVERVLGHAPQAVVGQSAFSFVHPDDAPRAIERFTRLVANPDCGDSIECRARHRNGAWRVLELRAKNLLHEPALSGVVVNARDVTEEREAERTRRRLNAFLEATPDFVAIFDPKGRALSVNTAFRRAAGIADEDDLASVTLSDLFPPSVTEVILHEGIPTASRQGVWTGETSLLRGGEEIPISQVILAHKSAAGSIEFLSTLARDITERKRTEALLRESEEYFRALIENAQDVITVLDPEGSVLFMSPSIERDLGYDPEELLGTNAFEMVHPDDLPYVREIFAEILRQPGVPFQTEYRARAKDGTVRMQEAVGTNLLDSPAVGGIVVNSRDITDRKAAERALRENEEQLRQSQKMDAVGRLAGGVAHDFNNLLTAIKGFTELLLLDFDERDPRRPFVAEIQGAANRAAALTRQLLAFSRKQVLQPKVMDLNESVAGMETMLRRLIGEDIEFAAERAPSLGCIRADPGQIEQVILNLVVNARDAMPNGGQIVVRTRSAELGPERVAGRAGVEPGRFVVLAVRDTGCGMDEETRARIFEPFFTTKGQGRGTGLGLSTVYGIVQQSGGLVEVESEVGRGTEFRVYLPHVEAEAERPEERDAPRSLTGSETVLLVEDELAVRVLVRRVLDRQGYRVLEAASGPEALELLEGRNVPVDLLLTDVVMPGMSGRDLADRLAGRYPAMRVLYMSGYTDDVISHHGVLDAGVAFVQKPFTPDALLRRLREILDEPPDDGPSPA